MCKIHTVKSVYFKDRICKSRVFHNWFVVKSVKCSVVGPLSFVMKLLGMFKLSYLIWPHKLVMLVALVSAQRVQSIHLLDFELMKTGTDMIEFAFPTHNKLSRPGYKTPSLQLKAYPADPGLCVVTHLREYIARTQKLRGSESKLLISYVRPHRKCLKTP